MVLSCTKNTKRGHSIVKRFFSYCYLNCFPNVAKLWLDILNFRWCHVQNLTFEIHRVDPWLFDFYLFCLHLCFFALLRRLYPSNVTVCFKHLTNDFLLVNAGIKCFFSRIVSSIFWAFVCNLVCIFLIQRFLKNKDSTVCEICQ